MLSERKANQRNVLGDVFRRKEAHADGAVLAAWVALVEQ